MKITSGGFGMSICGIVCLNSIVDWFHDRCESSVEEVVFEIGSFWNFVKQIRNCSIKVVNIKCFLIFRISSNCYINLAQTFIGVSQKQSINKDHPNLSGWQFSIETSESIYDFIRSELRECCSYLQSDSRSIVDIGNVNKLFIFTLRERKIAEES